MRVFQQLRNLLTSGRRRGCTLRVESAELLEVRELLSVSGFSAEIAQTADSSAKVTLLWNDANFSHTARYEIWIDQNISSQARNAKVFYAQQVAPDNAADPQYTLTQPLGVGNYTSWLRRIDRSLPGQWVRYDFQIDDDNNPRTPVVVFVRPDRPQVTLIREGQAAAGQSFSEGAIRWVGDSFLYDVWLGQIDASGRLQAYSSIRNVAGSSVTFRELALAEQRSGTTFHGDVAGSATPAQLETGDYRFFVRGVNAAVDSSGRWTGRGTWSPAVRFSFNRVEGRDAVPATLNANNSIRPVISWTAVPHAEAYLLSFWKGPDYQNHRPVNVRVYGTKYSPNSTVISDGVRQLQLKPGDEMFVRVRGIGSEGMLEGLRFGNFASTVFHVPDSVSPDDLTAPTITGPTAEITESMPVLRWQHSPHAATYDVWFTSLQTRQALFRATGIRDNLLYLHPNTLSRIPDLITTDSGEYSSTTGLADGSFRFWVRARNPAEESPGRWSKSRDFVVASGQLTQLSFSRETDISQKPLVSPNLVEAYRQDGNDYLLVANGLGESFGDSVLTRFVVDENGLPARPVKTDADTGKNVLTFPDLPMGSNVSDMAFLDQDTLAVLSRGSNELRVVDVANWNVLSTFTLTPGAAGAIPDAMDLEVLSNGQILVVFNRSNRLRVFNVLDGGTVAEVVVPGTTTNEQGFALPNGRAMQVSGVDRGSSIFTLFLATPSINGIAVMEYDAGRVTLTPARQSSGSSVPNVSRSRFAGTHIGGRTTIVLASNNTQETFYLNADRNGFLTWINFRTYDHGFVDLADFLSNASRDPDSDFYRNPNDNSFDPTRIVQVAPQHIAVMNGRERSVILRLSSTDGTLSAEGVAAMTAGYDAAVIGSGNTRMMVTSARGEFRLLIGTHALVTNRLVTDPDTGQVSVFEVATTQLANPVNDAVAVSENAVLVEFPGTQRAILEYSVQADQIFRFDLPETYVSLDETTWKDAAGAATAFHDVETGRSFVAIRVIHNQQPDTDALAVIDVTSPATPQLHSIHEIDIELRGYSIQLNRDELVILDRLTAEMVYVVHWNSAQPQTTGFNFFRRHGLTFGGSRPGKTVVMQDGTRVVLHDTTPDKVFSVFAPGNLAADQPIARVHAHNVGQWIFDMEVFDKDRVIAVTWDAQVVILNIRTGAFELVRQLDDFATTDLNLYAVRGISFVDGTLTVNVPAAAAVAEFEITREEVSGSFEVSLHRIISAPDLVTSVRTAAGQWVFESDRVRLYSDRN